MNTSWLDFALYPIRNLSTVQMQRTATNHLIQAMAQHLSDADIMRLVNAAVEQTKREETERRERDDRAAAERAAGEELHRQDLRSAREYFAK